MSDTGRTGRPKKDTSMTAAERQRKFRAERVMVKTGERMGNTIRRLADQFDVPEDEVVRRLLQFALCNRDWWNSGFSSGEDIDFPSNPGREDPEEA